MTPDATSSPARQDQNRAKTDILIIGAGPVGLACALLLGRCGWQVTVLERWPEPYPRPRAVHFDDEVARLLADVGIGGRIAQFTEPADIYEWQNGERRTLLRFDWTGIGPSGWPIASMFRQPDLEEALNDAAAATSGLTIQRGYEATELIESNNQVEVTARGRDGESVTFTAAWVIGCDGANSFVRNHMKTDVTDLGFYYDWLIVDVVPRESRVWTPINLQVCDPSRPTTVVSGGPGRRRWEFMRMPGETVEELNSEETAWGLLAPWEITPDNSTLERHTVYTFEARWADRWRSGRLILAGDSAHLMPPFAGQGMCSGIRDAANLSWKLDLVLRDLADVGLLDTYGLERSVHVQHAIGLSVELGKVICVTDADEAAQRDAFMISQDADPARILPPLPPSTLVDGVLHRAPDGAPGRNAGVLTPQARITYRGRTDLFDDAVGRGFVLISTEDPSSALNDDQTTFLQQLGTHIVHLVPPTSTARSENDECLGVDIEGSYLEYLATSNHVAALVRPDHYLFGGVETFEELPQLVEELRDQLSARYPRAQTTAESDAPASNTLTR